MKLKGIILFVRNVELLKEFYLKYFNGKVLEDIPGEWTLLAFDGAEIGLHKIGSQPSGYSNSPSNSNVKLVFDIRNDIHDLLQSMRQQGVVMREVQTFENYPYQLCDGEDPEGNVFQLRYRIIG